MRRSASPRRTWAFPIQAFAFGALIAIASNFPVLSGRVPLPADLLSYFLPWAEVPSLAAPTPHAETGDLLVLMCPWRAFLQNSLRRGELPYWNPNIQLGAPFLANPIAAVFYPPNWLYLILPRNWAWSLWFLLRTTLATAGASLLSRRLGAGRVGALAAGAVFALSGFMAGWQGWPQADTLLAAPWLLLALVELRRRPGPRSASLVAFAAALAILAGHPESALYVVGTGAAFAIYAGVAALRRGRDRAWLLGYLGACTLGAVLAGALCAVQLLPTVSWIPTITRRLNIPWGPLPARDAVAVVSRDARSSPNSIGIQIPEGMCYAGIATLLLCPLAFRGKRSVAMFFAASAVVALSVTFRWPLPPVSELFRSIPVLKGLPGHRILGIADLSLAVLASLGITELQRRRTSATASIIALGFAAAGVSALILLAHERVAPGARLRESAALLVVSAALSLYALLRRHPARGAVLALGAVLVLDVLTFADRHVPFVRAESIFPSAPVFDFLRSQLRGGQRVLFLSRTAPANTEMMYGLSTPFGYSQVLRSEARLLAPLNGGTDRDEPLRVIRAEGVLNSDPRLLDAMSVRYLVSSVSTESASQLERLERRYPTVFSSGGVRVFENRTAKPLVSGGGLRLDELETTSGGILFKATMPAAGAVVISVMASPEWRVEIDRARAALQLEGDFLRLRLPEGTHRVRLRYRPARFALGATISALALGAMLILCVRGMPTGAARLAARGAGPPGGPRRNGSPGRRG